MQTPVYETSIYTFKSPLALNPDDVIAYQLSGSTITVGINTIADYDKYYISTQKPTFGHTFLGLSVGDIDDAIISNSRGTSLSQETVNDLTIVNAGLGVTGYKKYEPLISSATVYLGETFTPKINVTNAILKREVINKLYVTSAYLSAPLYRVMTNKITKLMYNYSYRIKYFRYWDGYALFDDPYTGVGTDPLVISLPDYRSTLNPQTGGAPASSLSVPPGIPWTFNHPSAAKKRLVDGIWLSENWSRTQLKNGTVGPLNNVKEWDVWTSNGHKYLKQHGADWARDVGAVGRFGVIYIRWFITKSDSTSNNWNVYNRGRTLGVVDNQNYVKSYMKVTRDSSLFGELQIGGGWNEAGYDYVWNYAAGQDSPNGTNDNWQVRKQYMLHVIHPTTGVRYIISEIPQAIISYNNIDRWYSKVMLYTLNANGAVIAKNDVGLWAPNDQHIPPEAPGNPFYKNWLPDIPYYNGNFGYGDLPLSLLSENETGMRQLVFKYLWCDGTHENANNTAAVNRGSFTIFKDTLDPTVTANPIRTGPSAIVPASVGIFNIAKQQATDYGYSTPNFQYDDTFFNYSNKMRSNRIAGGSNFHNEELVPLKFIIKAVWMSGQITTEFQTTNFPKLATDVAYSTPVNGTAGRSGPDAVQYVEQRTNLHQQIPLSLSSAINTQTQSLNINNFDNISGVGGVRAFNLSTNSSVTLVSPSTITSLYTSAAKGDILQSNDSSEGYFADLNSQDGRQVDVTYNFGGAGGGITIIHVNNLQPSPKGQLALINPGVIPSPVDVTTFVKGLYDGSNFDTSRSFGFTLRSNQLQATRDNFSVTFPDTQIASSLDRWTVSLGYTSVTEPTASDFYTQISNTRGTPDTRGFSGASGHNVLFTFDSSGECLNNAIDGITTSGQIIARQADEQRVRVYEKFNITPVVETVWKSGMQINVPEINSDLITSLNIIPTYSPYKTDDSRVRIDASFIGNGLEPLNPVANDPDQGHLYDISFNSGATLIDATTENDLLNFANQSSTTLDLRSQLGLLKTETIATDDILRSFSVASQKIQNIGYNFPSNFYVTGITGASLDLVYQWGTDSKYDEYSGTYLINPGGETISILDNLTPASTVLSRFTRSDRERLFTPQTAGVTHLYMTTVRTNPAGYTFSEVEFPVTAYSGGAVRYRIHKCENRIDYLSQVQDIFDINNSSLVRSTSGAIRFKHASNQIIPSKFTDAGLTYTTSGTEIRSFSVTKTPSSSSLVNNFIVLKNTSTTYKNIGDLYLFVTPDVLEISGPIIPSGVLDSFYMREYLGTTGGIKTGIPTFGPTLQSLQSWAINSSGYYIITGDLSGATGCLSSSELNTSTPFAGVTGVSPEQISGFIANDYRMRYFPAETSGVTGRTLYAVPFNWNKNSDETFNIVYANNYIRLSMSDLLSYYAWAPYENRSYSPTIVTHPLYTDVTVDLSRYIDTAFPTKAGMQASNVRMTVGNYIVGFNSFTNVTGNTYTARIKNLNDSTIYGENGSFITMSGKMILDGDQEDININYLRRFYVPNGMEIEGASLFMGATYTQNITRLTKNYLTFDFSQGGAITYEGVSLASGVDHYFALVIDGTYETEFTLDPAEPTSVLVNFLKPETTYEVSLRYYPYANDVDTTLHDSSEVKSTGFSFTTPAGSELTAVTEIGPDSTNDRVYNTVMRNVKLSETINGITTQKNITSMEFVLESQVPSVKIYNGAESSFEKFTLASGFSQPIFLQLQRLVRGKYYYPFVYLKDTDGYCSNLVKFSELQVRIRPDATARLDSTGLQYKKLITLDNIDIYDSFLTKDYSLPSNDRGYLLISDDNSNQGGISSFFRNYGLLNLSNYPDRQYPSSGLTLLMDRAIDRTTNIPYIIPLPRIHYSQNIPDATSVSMIIVPDSTGKIPHTLADLDKIEDLNVLFNEVTGFTLSELGLGDNCILYGDIVLCAYSGVGATGVLSVDFLVTESGLPTLVDKLYGINNQLVFYDPSAFYTGAEPISKSSDRIDLFGNTGYNQYLTYCSLPNIATFGPPGACTLTYAQGGVYADTFYSFDTSVISLKPRDKVINIHLLRNNTQSLTDYIGLNVNYTAYECIYDGNVLDITNPNDLASKVCAFRRELPTQRDINNVPHPDLDYMLTVFKHLRDDLGYNFYFEQRSQIDAWNSSPVSNYWWTTNIAKPLSACPFRIMNRAIRMASLPTLTLPALKSFDDAMDGVVTTQPALYYGTVTITGFDYYKGDPVNNSYVRLYNPTTLLLRQVGGGVLASATIDITQPNYDNITFTLGSTMLSANTTYKMSLQFRYSRPGEGNFSGSVLKFFDYVVPADETNFDNVRQVVGIHKLKVDLGDCIFGNKSLSDINKKEQLTLFAKSQLNYRGGWTGTTGYTLLDAVTSPDVNGNTKLYWLRDISQYGQTIEPFYLAGWEDTSSYINFVGSTPVSKNDVFTYDGKLYKVGNDGTMFAPGDLDRNINRYPDYDTNILASKSYPFDQGDVIIFDKLIPNMDYDLNFKIAAGNSYGPKEYYGDYTIARYKTLPDKIESKGCDSISNQVVLSNIAYKNSSALFKTGAINYSWGNINPRYLSDGNNFFSGVTCSFAYNSNNDDPVLDNVYITYTPSNLLELTGMDDQTDVHRPRITLDTTCGSISIVQPFYNLVKVSVSDYNPKDVLGTAAGFKFIPSPNDSFVILKNGVFWQSVPLTTATFKYRLYDGTGNSDFLQTADIDFTFSITGLDDKTMYDDFSIRYRVQGTGPITGIPISVPQFTTTPKLSINALATLASGFSILKLLNITYCDVEYTNGEPLFPFSNSGNKIIATFQSSQSLNTLKPYMTSSTTATHEAVLPVSLSGSFPHPSSNTSNYSFDQVLIEYTAANADGVLETILAKSISGLNMSKGLNLNLIA